MLETWLHRGAKERSVTIVGEMATVQIDTLNQKLTLIRDEALQEIPVVRNQCSGTSNRYNAGFVLSWWSRRFLGNNCHVMSKYSLDRRWK